MPSDHDRHIGRKLGDIGKYIEDAIEFNGQRAHFAVLIWADTVQTIANTPRDGVAYMMKEHARILDDGKLKQGPVCDDT